MQELMHYKAIRSRRKSIALTLSAQGEIVVRAPEFLSGEEIGAFVSRHEAWISRQARALRRVPPVRLETGDALVLFGRRYLVADAPSRRACIKEDLLYLPAEGRAAACKRLISRLALAELTRTTRDLAAKFGFAAVPVRISSARRRWGSCSSRGRIAYSFLCAFLPRPLIEYIVIHELSHTKYLDHGAAFWQTVERCLPDWKTRRAQLKAYAPVMSAFPAV